MSDIIKRILRKIRGTFLPQAKPENALEKLIAIRKAEQHKREFWERDKKNKRAENFEKAKRALALKREAAQQEQERQAQIADQRLKNLKKARRKLAKKRSSK